MFVNNTEKIKGRKMRIIGIELTTPETSGLIVAALTEKSR